MLPRSLPRYSTLLCYLAIAACATTPPPKLQTIDVGTEFTLSLSGKAKIHSSNVEVQFMGVSEDSRCPREQACVWAGEAKVRLDITGGRRDRDTVLRDILEQQSVLVDDYEIKVIRVLPLPEANAKIPPSEYQVVLLATRT